MTKLWIILFFCASAVKSQIHSKTWCLKIIYSGDCSSLLSSSGEPKPSSHTSTEKNKQSETIHTTKTNKNTVTSTALEAIQMFNSAPAPCKYTLIWHKLHNNTLHYHTWAQRKRNPASLLFIFSIIRSETSQIWFTKMEMKDWSFYNICSFDVVYIILVMMSL